MIVQMSFLVLNKDRPYVIALTERAWGAWGKMCCAGTLQTVHARCLVQRAIFIVNKNSNIKQMFQSCFSLQLHNGFTLSVSLENGGTLCHFYYYDGEEENIQPAGNFQCESDKIQLF